MTNSKPRYNIEERTFEFENEYVEIQEETVELKKIFSASIEKSNVVCIVFENLILCIICILKFGFCGFFAKSCTNIFDQILISKSYGYV